MNNDLHGKIFLVVASSKGTGYGIASALAQGGARVSIGSRSADEIEVAADTLRS